MNQSTVHTHFTLHTPKILTKTMNRFFRSSWARLASGFSQTQIKIDPISRRIRRFSGDSGPGSWRSVEGLVRSPANFAPLSPISFLERAARVCGERTSVVYGDVSFTWNQTLRRCVKLASALTQLGISRGDVVATLAPNVPAMCELHFAVPMAGAVLCTLNTRHDSAMISTLLRHSSARVLFVDYQFLEIAQGALDLLAKEGKRKPLLILIPESDGSTDICEYETLMESGSDDFEIRRPESEFDPISVNYTSGTTSRPKGVVYSHRGAYLNTLATVLLHDMGAMPVYLWTVPMFHCNGWCLVWGVAAQTGTNICIRRVSPKDIFESIHTHGVNYMGGAPTVLNMIVNAPLTDQKKLPDRVVVLTGGAPPPPQVLIRMEDLGFSVIHIYGLTEVYGPSTSCVWKPEWNNLPPLERSRIKSRQGVQHACLEDLDVRDPLTMESVPPDGVTLGEIVFRGNTVMSGYLNDAQATNEAFSGGWFHSGDLAVKHADGYIEMKDRIKDIVISGGENVSTMEVETVLYGHRAVLEAAVVARPDRHWGQTVCAFVKVKDGFVVCEKEVIEFCRKRLPHYMAPKTVVFDDLPKTSTGKVQKFVLRDRAKAMGSLS